MPRTLASTSLASHPVIPDIGRPQMAKADVRKLDIEWTQAVGRAIGRAIAMVGWSHKEAAAKVQVDDAEFGKWLSGNRRAQFDRLFAVPELREALVVCLACLDEHAEIVTEIRFRRHA